MMRQLPNDDEGGKFATLLKEHYAFSAPRRGEVFKATILSLNGDGLIIDLPQSKRDGRVPDKDLDMLDRDYRESLEVGQQVPIRILKNQGREGYVLVSINQGLKHADWLRAEDLLESGKVVDAEVIDYNRGGVLVSFGRVRGFVPNSHLAVSRRPNNEIKSKYVGRTVSLVVLDVNQRRRRLVLSERKANRVQRQQVLDSLAEGDVRTGIVRNLVDFGAFVDLGGVDGLIHISELDWEYVEEPSNILSVGDEVEVLVLGVDRERERIELSRKRLIPDPGQSAPAIEVNELESLAV
jgi:small subunit ribosomal protein S1